MKLLQANQNQQVDPQMMTNKQRKVRLGELQRAFAAQAIPISIVLEGWNAAGKGSVIGKVILALDPRGFQVYALEDAPATEDVPFMAPYWDCLPARGEMAFFDTSWYQRALGNGEHPWMGKKSEERLGSINAFERQLTDDGMLIVKFFLHIEEEEQKGRFEKLQARQETAWRVSHDDWKQNEHYQAWHQAYEQMLLHSNTEYAPWFVIDGGKKSEVTARVMDTLIDCMQRTLDLRAQQPQTQPVPVPQLSDTIAHLPMPRLCEVNLSQVLSQERYEKKLKKRQKKLRRLQNQLFIKGIPLIVVYEGWDAAGKGGNIRRVAAALDPRGYDVVPIAAPSKWELAHHYLWRFWTQLPKSGHIAIFDRSWYGRVMVERLEGFCTEVQWQRAYSEINEFEKELTNWGAIVIKFWLQIDKDEQLRRFEDRQNTPDKQWKITGEDWRNREKWDAYEQAVDEMLQKTSTRHAPWHIIPSQDKKVGRIRTLDLLIEAIQKKLAE